MNIDGGVAAKICADAGLAVPNSDTTRWLRRVHPAWLGVLSLLSACVSVPAKPTLDCYTYLDYVEALRRSTAFDEFPRQVTAVRYREGKVSWRNRRHFLSDWVIGEAGPVRDVTARLGGAATVYARKELNRADEGGVLLKGIPVVQRTVAYVPAGQLDESLTRRLATGDYVGVYARAPHRSTMSAKPVVDVREMEIGLRDQLDGTGMVSEAMEKGFAGPAGRHGQPVANRPVRTERRRDAGVVRVSPVRRRAGETRLRTRVDRLRSG